MTAKLNVGGNQLTIPRKSAAEHRGVQRLRFRNIPDMETPAFVAVGRGHYYYHLEDNCFY